MIEGSLSAAPVFGQRLTAVSLKRCLSFFSFSFFFWVLPSSSELPLPSKVGFRCIRGYGGRICPPCPHYPGRICPPTPDRSVRPQEWDRIEVGAAGARLSFEVAVALKLGNAASCMPDAAHGCPGCDGFHLEGPAAFLAIYMP